MINQNRFAPIAAMVYLTILLLTPAGPTPNVSALGACNGEQSLSAASGGW